MNTQPKKEARRRSVLLTVAALGGLVCLLGGTVLFSALQDTAHSGTNEVDSAALAASADVQLATATNDGIATTCGEFSENLASGLFTASGVVASEYQSEKFFCIRSVGSQDVNLSAMVSDRTDVDVACTGDEALHGDTTCGENQVGELSSVLGVSYSRRHCETGSIAEGGSLFLKQNETTPQVLGILNPGATACFSVTLYYPFGHPDADVQQAQSDNVTWRFRFTGQA